MPGMPTVVIRGKEAETDGKEEGGREASSSSSSFFLLSSR